MTEQLESVRDELRSVARTMLAKSSPLAAGGRPPAAVDWSVLASAGWLGLDLPEAVGGSGATVAELAVVLTEMGRAATTSPYLGAAVLGAGALDLLEPGTGRDELLRALTGGETVVAVALPSEAVGADVASPFALQRTGTGLRVRGRAELVPDAAGADRLLLLASDDDGRPVLVATRPIEAGVTVTPRAVVDPTRQLATVAADDARVDPADVWPFAGGSGDPRQAVGRLLDRAALAMACDGLGIAEAMVEATTAYARDRHQFGRAIGSFQAVKHACADMLVAATVSRELVTGAAEALAGGADDAWVAVAMAKSHVGAAAVQVAEKAVQLHGGIGYTWDRGIHVYLKRAALDRALFGSPAAHRWRLAARYRDGDPGRAPASGRE